METCNQTVMSGPACSKVSENIDVFRGVASRSSTFVHGVSVVNRWLALHMAAWSFFAILRGCARGVQLPNRLPHARG